MTLPSRASARQRLEHSRSDGRPAMRSGCGAGDDRPGDTTIRRCGTDAIMSAAARRAQHRHRRSMTSTPIGLDDEQRPPPQLITAWRPSINGPRFSQGRRRSNPISRGDLAYKKADDHGRQPVDIVEHSLGGRPRPLQQRNSSAADGGSEPTAHEKGKVVAAEHQGTAGTQPRPRCPSACR